MLDDIGNSEGGANIAQPIGRMVSTNPIGHRSDSSSLIQQEEEKNRMYHTENRLVPVIMDDSIEEEGVQGLVDGKKKPQGFIAKMREKATEMLNHAATK